MGSDTDRSFYGGYKNILGLDQGGGLHITVNILGVGDGTHSSALAWKIPWTEEPGGLQSMGSLRVGQD